jgi:hypothetical protein
MNLSGNELRLLWSLAAEEAHRLGSTSLGPEDFLLAMLSPAFADSRAAKALARCSITRDLVEGTLHAKRSVGKPKRRGITSNHACHDMIGFASGLAAGLGTGEVTVEDVPIAQLYQPSFAGDSVSRRSDVFKALVELGVAVPTPPWPEPRQPAPHYDRVDVSLADLEGLVSTLPRLVPGGITWNESGKRGWIQPVRDVDLTAVIPFALDAWSRRRLPCPCCGNVTLNFDEPLGERRCPVCFWIDDAIQSNNPEYSADPNGISLDEARTSFARNGYARDTGRGKVRPPNPDETPPILSAKHPTG